MSIEERVERMAYILKEYKEGVYAQKTPLEMYRQGLEDAYEELNKQEPVSDKLGGINNALIQDKCVQEYPVCDDLEEEIGEFISASIVGIQYCRHAIVEWGKRVARHFTDWQKQQMMAKAVDVTIAIPYQNSEGGYTQLVDSKKGLPFGDNIKVLVIKED